MTNDRLDEAKRLHAAALEFNGPYLTLSESMDWLNRIDAARKALHALAPDLFVLAEAAEWVVKAFEPIDDDTMSFLHDLKSAVDRVRGR